MTASSLRWFPPRDTIQAVLRVSFPLILTSVGIAVKLFCDRAMLSHASPEALSAVLSAGLMSFCLQCFFMGIVNYTGTFVAQYTGAGREREIGVAVWQGLFVALTGGVLLATGWWWGRAFFAFVGHSPAVQVEQVKYFRILALGAAFPLMAQGLGTFWNGRGKTTVVMVISLLSTALNIFLNWVLIFGHLGAPALGIEGAALATIISMGFDFFIYLALFLRLSNRARFDTLPQQLFVWPVLKRLLRFGFPSGLQFMLDLLSFNIFIILLGRMGLCIQTASSIVFSINALAFLPMIGIGIGVSILVGQAVGAKDIPRANQYVDAARFLLLAYSLVVVWIYSCWPGMFLGFFAEQSSGDLPGVSAMVTAFLCFIAIYQVFDCFFVLYHSALKGAGDTFFSMVAGVFMAWFCFAIPAYCLWRFQASVWYQWILLDVYVSLAGCVFYWRYRQRAWERMQVIEPE